MRILLVKSHLAGDHFEKIIDKDVSVTKCDCHEAKDLTESYDFHVAITNSMDSLIELRDCGCSLPAILVTEFISEEMALEAAHLNAYCLSRAEFFGNVPRIIRSIVSHFNVSLYRTVIQLKEAVIMLDRDVEAVLESI